MGRGTWVCVQGCVCDLPGPETCNKAFPKTSRKITQLAQGESALRVLKGERRVREDVEAREGGREEQVGWGGRKEKGLGEGWGWGEEGRKKWKGGRGKGGETSLCSPVDRPLRSH